MPETVSTEALAELEARLDRHAHRTRRIPAEPLFSIEPDTLRGLVATIRTLMAERDEALKWHTSAKDWKRLCNAAEDREEIRRADLAKAQERIAGLEEGLRPFAEIGEYVLRHYPNSDGANTRLVQFRHLRCAANLLQPETEKQEQPK